MPKVSIVVPCWGVEKYLDRCVNSLVSQTLKDIEIILVDDESPDRVPEMCDEWARKDFRIKVVHKKNAGLGMACNSGLQVVTGDFVAFCDSDDWMDSEAYERMYIMAASSKSDVLYTGIQTVDSQGRIRKMNSYSHLRVIKYKAKIIDFAMDMICSKAEDSVESHVAMSAKVALYKRSLIEKHRLRFVSERQFITEDLIWNLSFLAKASVVTLMPEVFYYYYNNESSLSKKVRLDRFPYFIANYKELSRLTAQMQFPEEVQVRIDRMFIRYVRHQVGDVLLSSYSFRKKYLSVNDMLKNEMTINVLSSFPTYKLIKYQRAIIWLMRHNCVMMLYLLFKIKR